MEALATALTDFVSRALDERLHQAGDSRVQPVFVGPPLPALRALFRRLTNDGTADWSLTVGGVERQVVVLLVDDVLPDDATATPRSQRCNWDYAVTVRNSVQVSISLVAPLMWDSRPESMANATDILGAAPRTQWDDYFRVDTWTFVIQRVSSSTGLPLPVVRMALRIAFGDTRELLPRDRDEAVWSVAGRLLELTDVDELPLRIGLPSIDAGNISVDALRSGEATLHALSKLCSNDGFDSARQRLDDAVDALVPPPPDRDVLHAAVGEMFAHLRRQAGTGNNFNDRPTAFLRPANAEAWWRTLTVTILERLLGPRPIGPRPQRLRVAVAGVLNQPALPGEPLIVRDEVRLQLPPDVGTVRVLRALPRQRAAVQWSGDSQEWSELPPTHNAPITYRVEAAGFTPWQQKILCLRTYGLGAFARFEGAANNPVATGVGQRAEQSITLDRPGAHRLVFFVAETSARVTVSAEGQVLQVIESSPYALTLDCEHGDDFSVAVRTGGQAASEWQIKVNVQEPEGSQPTSRFEALVVANQQNQRRIRPVAPVGAANLRRLEELWLGDTRSWRGVLAAWSAGTDTLGSVNWEQGMLGDLQIALDVRPPLEESTPPPSYLSARDAIRAWFISNGRTIAEVDLSSPEFTGLLGPYLSSFREWQLANPAAAAWADCVALHAPLQNAQARQEIPTHEPVAFLLTPLHPVRLAWHAVAQRVLMAAVEDRRCPSAGMLNPHGVPLSMGLPLAQSQRGASWRTFFASGTNDPHWSLFWNRENLRSSQERALTLERLRWLGLQPRAITPGFTESQAMRSLEAVAEILPARVSMRVGLIGSTQESDACVDGILKWSETAITASDTYSIPARQCDVFDLRENPAGPSAATLASVADQTGERVRWFRREPAPPATLDVVVLDQLGTLEPRGVQGSARSAITPNALFRLNVRNDLSGGLLLHESRIVQQQRVAEGDLEAGLLLAATAIETTSLSDQGTAVLEFRPNQEAIGQRLGQALFVATTSSQLDPACLIRSVRNQQAYLWDYDLPGIIGLNEERAGYYLIANPPPALQRAVSAAVGLVTEQEQPVGPILDEISRRGIPVLKRMAAGGNQARGEIGVLLTVRFLQDAFRAGGVPRVRLPISAGDCLNFILPLDPYWDQLAELRKAVAPDRSEQRPDLIVFSVRATSTGEVAIRVVPVEVKFRTERLSSLSVGQALQQAASLGALLGELWTGTPLNELWQICGRGLLAQCLDHCFRIYADTTLHGNSVEYWSTKHEAVLSAVLAGTAEVSVASEGRAVIIDGSPDSGAFDFDGDRRADTLIISRSDARSLMDGIAVSGDLERAFELMELSVGGCGGAPSVAERDATQAIPVVQAPPGDGPAVAVEPPAGEANDIAPEPSVEPLSRDDDDLVEGAVSEPESATTEARPDVVDPSVRAHVRSVFADFIGNEAAVHRVSNDLIRALIERPPHLAKNYLFTGQPSTGKTELARRMSNALGLPFVRLDGRGVASRDRLFDLIEQEVTEADRPPAQVGQSMGMPVLEYPAMVVFIDEVHLMPKPVQESLLTMLEAGDRRVALRGHVALVGRATFLFATTRPSDLDAAFRSRCTEVPLREYEVSEVATMLERRFPHADWPPDVYLRVAKLGRVVPRVAIELARELETEITVSEHQARTPLEHLDEVRRAREIDAEGLTRDDLRYLSILDTEARPVGETPIINMMGTVDRDRVTNEIEPFLRRLGLIKFGARGREIMPAGREYLANSRRDRAL